MKCPGKKPGGPGYPHSSCSLSGQSHHLSPTRAGTRMEETVLASRRHSSLSGPSPFLLPVIWRMEHTAWTLAQGPSRAEVFVCGLLLLVLFLLLVFLLRFLLGTLCHHPACQLSHGEVEDTAAEALADPVLHLLLEAPQGGEDAAVGQAPEAGVHGHQPVRALALGPSSMSEDPGGLPESSLSSCSSSSSLGSL